MHAAAARQRFRRAHNVFRLPIAAFHQNIGLHLRNQIGGRVAVKPRYQIHAGERRHHRRAVCQRIDGAVVALALPLHRGIGVQRQHHARPQRAGLGKIGDMPAVQNVEAAVSKHQRARQLRQRSRQLLGRDDFLFKLGRGVSSHGCS